jgi:hypothetical protein
VSEHGTRGGGGDGSTLEFPILRSLSSVTVRTDWSSLSGPQLRQIADLYEVGEESVLSTLRHVLDLCMITVDITLTMRMESVCSSEMLVTTYYA